MSSIIDDAEEMKRLADAILSSMEEAMTLVKCDLCPQMIYGEGVGGKGLCSFCYDNQYNDRDME